ncbi:MAG: NAD(P)-binding domain-containing protein [Alphaproteobacteria bacterium]
MDIGFIGDGEVADAIMDRLREVGHRLHHHSHIHGRGSLRALAERCDVVMMLLPDARAEERVLFAQDGLAAALPGGGLLIDLSSLPPDSAAANAARIADLGGQLVDAPVSGGVGGYRIDIGGSDAACAWAESLLRVFTSTVERAGGPGTGQRARLARSADRRTAGWTGDDPDGLHRLLRLMAFDEANCALSAG